MSCIEFQYFTTIQGELPNSMAADVSASTQFKW